MITKLAGYLVREAAGLDDNEPVTLHVGAESVRGMALAAVREQDALRDELDQLRAGRDGGSKWTETS